MVPWPSEIMTRLTLAAAFWQSLKEVTENCNVTGRELKKSIGERTGKRRIVEGKGVGQLSHPARTRLAVHPQHKKPGPWGLANTQILKAVYTEAVHPILEYGEQPRLIPESRTSYRT